MEIAVVNRYFDSSERKLYFLEFENVCNSTEKCKTELIEHNKKYKNMSFNKEKIKTRRMFITLFIIM